MNEINDLLSRIKRLEANLNINSRVLPSSPDPSPVPGKHFLLVSATSIATGITKVVLTWEYPESTNIDRFEVWVKRNISSNETPYLAASVLDAPLAFTVFADTSTIAVAYLITVTKSGFRTPFNLAPTVSFSVS